MSTFWNFAIKNKLPSSENKQNYKQYNQDIPFLNYPELESYKIT